MEIQPAPEGRGYVKAARAAVAKMVPKASISSRAGEPPFWASARHNGIRYFRSINLLGNSLSDPRADFATRSREKTLVDDAVSPRLSAFNAGMAGVWQCKPINSV